MVRALVIGLLLSGALGILFGLGAQGCTDGVTPVCAGDAGCDPDVPETSLDAVEEISPEP